MPTPVDSKDDPALYVSIQRAAQLCDVSTDTIRRLIARGELEAVRFSRQLIRVRRDSLEAYGRPIGGAGR